MRCCKSDRCRSRPCRSPAIPRSRAAASTALTLGPSTGSAICATVTLFGKPVRWVCANTSNRVSAAQTEMAAKARCRLYAVSLSRPASCGEFDFNECSLLSHRVRKDCPASVCGPVCAASNRPGNYAAGVARKSQSELFSISSGTERLIFNNFCSLWERACSRRGHHIQHSCWLIHRLREQARSHKGLQR